MLNKAMERKLQSGDALDVSAGDNEQGPHYRLLAYVDGKDYCDAKRERWIWSIGKRKSDGVIIASTDNDLYQNEAFECLWLR